jgi:hypothetical protein
MPARMPHNNRMSTSATLKTHAIWQTAIGHDPYANAEEKEDTVVTEADKEKARSVMEMARSQNLTDGAKRDNFTAQMYQGLKKGKQRRADASKPAEAVDPELQQLLEAPSSSSEDEFLEVDLKKEEKKKSSSSSGKKKHRKRRKRSSSNDSDDSSSDESSDDRRERRRKDKRKKKHRKRSRDSSSSSDDSDAEEEIRRRKRKDKRRHKERKKSSHKERK